MICYVILHYQAIEETETCVTTIKTNTTDDFRVIIVDNASPNGSGKILQDEYNADAGVTVILSKENSGFAKGNNLGYKKAKKFNPDFVVVLNSDVEITQPDFCERLSGAYQNYGFDVLGPDIYSTKGNYHQNPQRETNYTLDELRVAEKNLKFKDRLKFLLKIKYSILHKTAKQEIRKNDYKSIQIGKVLHGACYVFSKKFIEKHDNCFYPGTFMYYESYILHYLGMKEGMVFLYDPDVVVKHHEDASTNTTYNDQYKKSIFVNKCLLDSCRAFINVMNDRTTRI